MNCLFLYNPNSGKGKIKKKLGYIERSLKETYEEVTLYAPSDAADLTDAVREGADKYDAIIFSGGDGTFNNVLQGVGDRRVKLGYLPSGTANDVARSLGIPKSVKGALKVIKAGHTDEIDCMQTQSDFVMYVAAAGAFTDVTYLTPQAKKRRLGWFAYVFSLLKYFNFDCHNVTVECGGKREELCATLAFVMNGRSVSGFFVNKRASMQDGVIDVAVILGKPNLNFFKRLYLCLHIVHFFLFGDRSKKKYIRRFRGEEVTIATDNGVTWDFDGERGPQGNLQIKALNRRVTLFVPQNKKI